MSEPGDTAAEVVALLHKQLNDMPPQLQMAARFILERPQDVALMSMREQAYAAGVSHSTMMRLAEWLGLDGYAALRQAFVRSFREGAGMMTIEPPLIDAAGSDGAAAAIASSIMCLASDKAQLAAAAQRLMTSRTIVLIGSAQETPIIRHAAHLFETLGAQVHTAEQGLTADCGQANTSLLAISFRPHGAEAKQAMRLAVERSLPSVAITDDANALVAKLAQTPVIFQPAPVAPNISSLTPAIAAVEAISSIWQQQR
jgi:DNA-binding MurR/RpiR family transcriptional regulator